MVQSVCRHLSLVPQSTAACQHCNLCFLSCCASLRLHAILLRLAITHLKIPNLHSLPFYNTLFQRLSPVAWLHTSAAGCCRGVLPAAYPSTSCFCPAQAELVSDINDVAQKVVLLKTQYPTMDLSKVGHCRWHCGTSVSQGSNRRVGSLGMASACFRVLVGIHSAEMMSRVCRLCLSSYVNRVGIEELLVWQ